MFTLFIGDGPKAALWRKLPRFLFRLGPRGEWKRMGQYRPWLDGHGPFQTLEALEDGTFLALSQAWFRDGDRASPCARYALGAGGELAFQGLVNLRVDRALPGARPGPDGTDQAWFPWREGVRVAREDKVLLLVAESMEWVTLVDPRDGRPLRAVALPRSPGGSRLTYPDFLTLPDGRIYYTGGQAAHGREAPRSPGGELAADLVGLPAGNDEVVRVAFRLDLRTGSWIREALPPEASGAEALEGSADPGGVTVVPSGRGGTGQTMR
jgi:hypothetical protein